jgi:hypothetical protein
MLTSKNDDVDIKNRTVLLFLPQYSFAFETLLQLFMQVKRWQMIALTRLCNGPELTPTTYLYFATFHWWLFSKTATLTNL